jgi:hypothetical protein
VSCWAAKLACPMVKEDLCTYSRHLSLAGTVLLALRFQLALACLSHKNTWERKLVHLPSMAMELATRAKCSSLLTWYVFCVPLTHPLNLDVFGIDRLNYGTFPPFSFVKTTSTAWAHQQLVAPPTPNISRVVTKSLVFRPVLFGYFVRIS